MQGRPRVLRNAGPFLGQNVEFVDAARIWVTRIVVVVFIVAMEGQRGTLLTDELKTLLVKDGNLFSSLQKQSSLALGSSLPSSDSEFHPPPIKVLEGGGGCNVPLPLTPLALQWGPS